MSNLKTILERLVQENLHGPIDHGNQNRLKSQVMRQTQIQTQTASAGNHQDPHSHLHHSKKSQEITHNDGKEEDLDSQDPRWRQLFYDFFLSEHSDDRNDDLLFFVQRVPLQAENGGLGVDPVFVKRNVHKGGHAQSHGEAQHSILTPEQEEVVLWKDTFFLNVIVQLPCKLTVAVCSRVAETNPITGVTKTSMTCTKKHVSKRVYALPTKARVDVKEATVECSWPLIYYVIDDYEDTFEQLMVQDNEYLCVELAVTLPSSGPVATATATAATATATATATTITASTGGLSSPTAAFSRHHPQKSRPGIPHETLWNQPPSANDGVQIGKPFPNTSGRGGFGGGNKITLFQGAAGFQNLLGIYQQKASTKVGKRFKFGPHTVPTEFVMMRGPGGRGHAQVAITASNIGDDSSPLNTNAHASAPTSPVQAPVSASFSTHNPKLSTTEKSLPPIPGSGGHYSNSSTNMKENGYSNNQPEVENPNVSPSSPTQANSAKSIPVPPNTSSSSKSFSAGSFFQSLRRLSMATLAQAVAHAPTSPTSTNINPLNTAGNNPHPNSSIPSSQVGKRHSIPSYDNRNGSGISTSGVGSRQEIEALVKQPPSLRCCMTFVNVPWTGIASLLMDHAYNHQSTIQEQ